MPQRSPLDTAANQPPIDLDGMDFDGYQSDEDSHDQDDGLLQSDEPYNSLTAFVQQNRANV